MTIPSEGGIDKKGIEEMNKRKHLIAIVMSVVLCLGLSTQTLADSPSFADVPTNHWAYTFVDNAAKQGLIAGYDDGTFGVNDQVTYAQLSTMLVRAFYNDEYESYDGPNDTWYAAFCGVADAAGLLDGTNAEGKLQDGSILNQPVNRYDMAQMMYNILVTENVKQEYNEASVQSGIADWNSIPEKYGQAVMGAVSAGIISGVDDQGTFDGNNLMTRGQAAVVMTQVNGIVSGSTQIDTQLYEVTRVIDGDTIEVNYNGTLEKVRLIGVDTPESVHPDSSKNTEEGILASDYTKEHLEGKQVGLEFDVQQRDQYGRLLAYVWVDGKMYNKTLLEDGVANIATYPPNVKYVDDFKAIVEARNQSEEDNPIKTSGVYVGSLESDKYHYPDCRYAQSIDPENEIWFDTEEEAISAGYSPCGVCKP